MDPNESLAAQMCAHMFYVSEYALPVIGGPASDYNNTPLSGWHSKTVID